VIGFEEVVSGRSYRIYPDRRWVNPIADGTPANPGGPFDLTWRRTDGAYLDLDSLPHLVVHGLQLDQPQRHARHRNRQSPDEGSFSVESRNLAQW
jgi:hypothetical protein